MNATVVQALITYENNDGVNVTETLNGTSITYTGGDVCPSGNASSFSVNVYCSMTLDIVNTRYSGMAQGDACNPYVEIVSSLGCNVLSHSILWEYLDLIKPYLGFVSIVMGVFLCFLGLKIVKVGVCLAGFLSCTLASCILFYAVYFNTMDDVNTFFYFLGGGLIAGIIVGILLACFIRFGAAVLAGWGGFALGLLIN